MNHSFQNYLITKTGTEEVIRLKSDITSGGRWGTLSTLLFIVIFVVIAFLFIVQEDITKRVFAIVTGLASLVPIILKLFDQSVSGSRANAGKEKAE